MPDFCTCGAELPPDAIFCHKCGKPQRAITAIEPEPEPAPPPPPPALATPPPPEATVTFRDRVAVRIALRVGVAATLIGLILPLINWLGAGFFAVFFYRRNTGRQVNVNAGAHMGWITAVLMFPMWILAIVAQLLPTLLSGRFQDALAERMRTFQPQDPVVQQQVTQLLHNPSALVASGLFMVAFFFLLSIGLSVAGGALGAKMSNRQ